MLTRRDLTAIGILAHVSRHVGAALARKLGGECIGIWPGGPLHGQPLDAAAANLIGSLREAAAIARDNGLLASVELEPPFPFNTIDMLIRIVDGVDHPCLRGMYDPSHFDLMTGGKGAPEEGLRRVGVERIGYLHLTDSDGTIFGGTSRHLPCGEGHIDIAKCLELLGEGGYTCWIMIDAWMTEDPYRACRKGKEAVLKVLNDAGREPAKYPRREPRNRRRGRRGRAAPPVLGDLGGGPGPRLPAP